MLGSKERIKRNQEYNMNIGLFTSLLFYVKILIEVSKLREDKDLTDRLTEIEAELLSNEEKKSE